MFGQIVYINLVGVNSEKTALEILLKGLHNIPPSEKPDFPGPMPKSKPPFPGTVADPVSRKNRKDLGIFIPDSSTVDTLPPAGIKIVKSPPFSPPMFSGLRVYEEDVFAIDFILSLGDGKPNQEELFEIANRLTKYFLCALTIPECEQWVNLSPYESDKIMGNDLKMTEMGRDLLIQDYILKQLTATLTYPEKITGKRYWESAFQANHDTLSKCMDINTFNKVWVMPESAEITEDGNFILIASSHLKALLEKDYVALIEGMKDKFSEKLTHNIADDINSISSTAFKNILLQDIESDVNEGGNFAVLRQIFHSMILSIWYKQKLKNSIIDDLYIDKGKTAGLEIEEDGLMRKIYDQYLTSFKMGVFEYIREDYDPISKEVLPSVSLL